MDASPVQILRGYRLPRASHRPLPRALPPWLHPELLDIQEMMPERGIEVSYEAIRWRCPKFGAKYARRSVIDVGILETEQLDEVFR